MNKYSDIIDHPHYQSKTRPHMSMQQRAAQFMPFAALSGFDDAVKETFRITDQRVELDEDELALLNDKLQYLYVTKSSHPQVSITYFVNDIAKEGGSYETITGTVKNIDSVFYAVVMDDGMLIPIKDIFAIEL